MDKIEKHEEVTDVKENEIVMNKVAMVKEVVADAVNIFGKGEST